MYELLIETHAERDLERLKRHSSTFFLRITSCISTLKEDPRPPGVRKIVGSKSDWRISVGDYRVIYEINDHQRTIRVYRVKHRREAYR